jgi:hypothetical protein
VCVITGIGNALPAEGRLRSLVVRAKDLVQIVAIRLAPLQAGGWPMGRRAWKALATNRCGAFWARPLRNAQ